MNKTVRKALGVAASVVLATGVAACGDDEEDPGTASPGTTTEQTDTADGGSDTGGALEGNLAGAGASSQDAAQQAWIAGFQTANEGVTVSYDPVGSGGGREQFIAGGTAYGGTDSLFEDEELKGAQDRCGGVDKFVEIPVYISPIALVYNVDGVDELNLKPETIAAIFKGDITSWDDEAIQADNPDADLPGERITVVHRSDESGTTENFADYLSKVAPDVWDFEVSGDWPVQGQEAANGTSGVIDAVENGAFTIGYADASQAGDLGTVNVGVGEEFQAPSPEAAAAVVEGSKEIKNPSPQQVTYELNRETEAGGEYPIVLVSYAMACTEYDDANEAALVKGLLTYIVSPEGQQASADNAGSAPLSDALTQQVTPAVEAIQG